MSEGKCFLFTAQATSRSWIPGEAQNGVSNEDTNYRSLRRICTKGSKYALKTFFTQSLATDNLDQIRDFTP
jgi:hypothetical protein